MSIPRDAIFTEEEHLAADRFAIEVNPYNDPNLMPGLAESQGPQNFYVAEVERRWPAGSTLRVVVINNTGDSKWANKIINVAKTWEKYANLILDIVDYDAIKVMPSPRKAEYEDVYMTNGDIRVVVQSGDTFNCSSFIGTTCKLVARTGQPSIQFQFGKKTIDDPWVQATILHEFGHALGFRHEHNNGNATIEWNTKAVYADFKEEQGWDETKVNNNFFNFEKFTGEKFDQSAGYDKASIMTYAIKNTWVMNSKETTGWYAGWNTVLSDTDKRGALKLYPVTEGAIIYEHADYGGDFKILRPGTYVLSDLGIGNDTMSSLNVVGDVTVVLYEHYDFTGRNWHFIGNQSCSNLGSFNDIVSAIKVLRGSPKAIIYSDADYKGNVEFLMSAGDYNTDKLGIGNDQLTSLRVFSGSTVTLFEHGNFSGDFVDFTSDSANVGDYWNDKTSSIRVK